MLRTIVRIGLLATRVMVVLLFCCSVVLLLLPATIIIATTIFTTTSIIIVLLWLHYHSLKSNITSLPSSPTSHLQQLTPPPPHISIYPYIYIHTYIYNTKVLIYLRVWINRMKWTLSEWPIWWCFPPQLLPPIINTTWLLPWRHRISSM